MMVKLGDILLPQPKSKIKAGEGLEKGTYKFFTSSNIQTKFIDTYQYDKPALIFGTGGNASIHFCDEKFATSTDCLVFYAKEKYILKTIYFYLSGNMEILENGFKGAGLKHISKQYILDIEFYIPPLEEQHKIAETLDKVSDLIAKRKQQLEKLDLLVKSKFLEMFGDPILNNKGWTIKKVIEECDCMVPGRDKPKTFTGDIPWITIDDLCLNSITYKSKQNLGLTQKEIDDVNRKAIPKDSVIMSCVGNLGICSIAGTDMVINQQLHSFQCHRSLNNIYLMYYLGQRKDYMNQQATSTTVLYMNKSVCNSIPTMVPPIELQNQFADFVKQTEKTKTIINQSLEKLEILKKALMQEYFG